jgi:beta-N-acetylhexosaminidase
VIEFPDRRPSPVEEPLPGGTARGPSLADAIRRFVPRTRGVPVDAGSATASTDAALDAGRAAEVIVCATRDAYLWQADQKLVGNLAALGRRTILIALRNPYDVAVLPRTDERIAAYADVPATHEALARALTGRAGWPGRLPMVLSGAPLEGRP